jgi:hypothetical protein
MLNPTDMLEFEEAGEPGTTATLTNEGWQAVTYEEPADDWRLLADGSWESPDGLTRSYPLDAPTGD